MKPRQTREELIEISVRRSLTPRLMQILLEQQPSQKASNETLLQDVRIEFARLVDAPKERARRQEAERLENFAQMEAEAAAYVAALKEAPLMAMG